MRTKINTHALSRICRLGSFILLAVFVVAARPSYRDGVSWSFAVLGDSRNGPEIFSKLITLIRYDPSRPELVFHTGDMVARGISKKQWKKYREITSMLDGKITVYPVVGNHETLFDRKLKNYKAYARPPGGRSYYSFEHRDAGFVVLNSYEPKYSGMIGPGQMKWLKETLEKLRSRVRIIFAFIHKPLVTRETYRHPRPLKNHAELERIFEAEGVLVVFMGHEHRYDAFERGGIHYIVTAGAGAPLYGADENAFHHYCRVTVGADKVTIAAVGLNGSARREVKIPVK